MSTFHQQQPLLMFYKYSSSSIQNAPSNNPTDIEKERERERGRNKYLIMNYEDQCENKLDANKSLHANEHHSESNDPSYSIYIFIYI